jgi:hypothetical protein
MTRQQIEAVAQRYGVKIDGLDNLVAARLVLSKVPGTNPNASPGYVEAAVSALAGAERRGDGANGETARTVEEHRTAAAYHAAEAARLEKDGFLTAAGAHQVAAAAHKKAAGSGGEERDPVGSAAARTASAKAAIVGVAHPKGTATGRADAERVLIHDVVRTDSEVSAKVARERMVLDAETAWRSPLSARRVDDAGDIPPAAPHIDARAPIEQLEAATARAQRRAREDGEAAWMKPLRSDARVEA